jgi:transcriptional regulator NrdR family protein
MKCSICGAESSAVLFQERPHEHQTVFSRLCLRGHRFTTVEVPISLLADKRELTCAQRNIDRRIARYLRDIEIAQDSRPSKVVAAEHGLTETRVRQIRASFLNHAKATEVTKIV